jgi:hypothetical protein
MLDIILCCKFTKFPAAGEALQTTPAPKGSLSSSSGGRQRDTASVMNPAAEYGGFSYALPSRKRGADSARLSTHENQAKARRFSPPLFEDLTSDVPVNNSLDHGSVDFIDLTGDDDEFIAEQIKAEQRQKQEQSDRAFARFLSSQDSSGQMATHSPQSNAFTRIMSSQPPPGPLIADEESPSRMLGAYDTRWDDSTEAGPAFRIPQRQLNPQYIPLPAPPYPRADKEEPDVSCSGSATRLPHPTGRAEHIVPGMGMGYPDLTRRGVHHLPHMAGMSGLSYRPPASFMPGSFASPSSLSEIIGRTNRFDLTYGVPCSTPLPIRPLH